MVSCKLYAEAGAVFGNGHIPEDVWRQVESKFVRYCVDVLLIDPEKRTVWLPKRKALPAPIRWYFGGRVNPGEVETAAAARIMVREAKLTVLPTRFQFVRSARYFWSLKDGAYDGFGQIHSVQLTPAELQWAAEHLDSKEYDAAAGLIEFDAEALQGPDIHKTLRDTYSTIFGQRRES